MERSTFGLRQQLVTTFVRLSLVALLAIFTLYISGCSFTSSRPSPTPPVAAKTNKIVKVAFSQVGKKYALGGASPQKGFDCSGLVWWSYKQHGIKVPRITADQAKAGKSVPKKHARAGDIVVFKTSNSPRGLHTGIYCGDGKFIHSPRLGKRVCVENMDPVWTRMLITIRRITG